jgi:hypothetical protein
MDDELPFNKHEGNAINQIKTVSFAPPRFLLSVNIFSRLFSSDLKSFPLGDENLIRIFDRRDPVGSWNSFYRHLGSEKEIHVSKEIKDRVRKIKFSRYGFIPFYAFHAIMSIYEELLKSLE